MVIYRGFEFISPISIQTVLSLDSFLIPVWWGITVSYVVFIYFVLKVSFVTEELEETEEPQRLGR